MIERINYWGALRRGWRLLVALAIVCAVVAVFVPQPKTQPKAANSKYDWRAASYVAALSFDGIAKAGVNSHTILFWANNFYVKGAAIVAAGQGSQASQLLPQMTAKLVNSDVATQKLKVKAKAKKSTSSATSKSKAGSQSTQFIQLLVAGTDVDPAVKLANAYATAVENAVNKAYATYRAGLSKQQQDAQPNASSGFVIVAPALASHAAKVVAKAPKSSQLGRKELVAIGVGVGLLLGALIILAREYLNRTVQTTAGTEASFLFPVVAEIPQHDGEGADRPTLAVVDHPTSPAAEAYRMLRMSLLFEGFAEATTYDDPYGAALVPERATLPATNRPPDPDSRQVVLVVSPGEEPSRPVLTANLAAAYAEAGERVIVINTRDIDSARGAGLRGPRTDLVDQERVMAELQPTSLAGVSRLSLRPFVGGGGQLANRAPEILAVVRQLADVVILEVPPLLAVHHGEALMQSVDVLVVVAEARTTPIAHAQRAGEILRRMGAPVLGVALTNVRLSSRDVRKTSEPAGSASPSELESAGSRESIGEVTSA